MTPPKWLKPGLYGAVLGAAALAIVGFNWAGWMTSSKAQRLAFDQARVEVVAALVPVCIEKSVQDPRRAETLTELKNTRIYQRSDLLMKTGWATMPGSSEADSYVASACMDKLAAQF
jgi:hypothetical protein